MIPSLTVAIAAPVRGSGNSNVASAVHEVITPVASGTPTKTLVTACVVTEGGAPLDDAALRALHAAADAGVTLYDTADVYGDGHSERLIARFLRERSGERLYVVTKMGRRVPQERPASVGPAPVATRPLWRLRMTYCTTGQAAAAGVRSRSDSASYRSKTK